MAPTALTPVTLVHTSATLLDASNWSAANAVDGNTIPNSGGSTLVGVNNSGASSRTVNVKVSRTVDGLELAATARQFTLAAGDIRFFKLGPINDYGSTVLVTASHAEVKIRAYQL